MNPFGHLTKCACSADCRAYRVAVTRAWKMKNPEKRKAQDKRYREKNRGIISVRLKEYQSRPEVREAKRNWRVSNPEKVKESNRKASQIRDKEVHRAQQKEWRKENREYVLELQKRSRAMKAQIVNSKASNSRTPWTEAELNIALDRSKTIAEAALLLGRSTSAISNQRYKVRRATNR